LNLDDDISELMSELGIKSTLSTFKLAFCFFFYFSYSLFLDSSPSVPNF